jgi:hypothetical protein
MLTERNNAIDFVKGFLVLAMAAYHTLNYFVEGHPLVYSYLFYVGPAFIFFSGVMCGTIYLDQFKIDKKYVSSRLAARSLKLVALFFGLNILIHLVLRKNYTGQRLGINLILDNLDQILLRGDAGLMAFEILIPISYVLLLSLIFLHFARLKYFLYVFVFLMIFVLSLSGTEMSYNLYYGLFGVAGVCTGLLCTELKSKLRGKFTGFLVTFTLSLYFFVLIPGGFSVRANLIIYFIYVNVVIAASYLLGCLLGPNLFIPRVIIKFGQYSLYLYLAQILFLQVFYRLGVSRAKFITMKTFIVFAAVTCSMIVLSYLTDHVRSRFLIVEKVYRFVFA